MTELSFDKGLSLTGIYETHPRYYSMTMIQKNGILEDYNRTLINPENGAEFYKGRYLDPKDPYAYHSREEIDQALEEQTKRYMMGEKGMTLDAADASLSADQAKILAEKYGNQGIEYILDYDREREILEIDDEDDM